MSLLQRIKCWVTGDSCPSDIEEAIRAAETREELRRLTIKANMEAAAMKHERNRLTFDRVYGLDRPRSPHE